MKSLTFKRKTLSLKAASVIFITKPLALIAVCVQ